jgi:hypothetical protein
VLKFLSVLSDSAPGFCTSSSNQGSYSMRSAPRWIRMLDEIRCCICSAGLFCLSFAFPAEDLPGHAWDHSSHPNLWARPLHPGLHSLPPTKQEMREAHLADWLCCVSWARLRHFQCSRFGSAGANMILNLIGRRLDVLPTWIGRWCVDLFCAAWF